MSVSIADIEWDIFLNETTDAGSLAIYNLEKLRDLRLFPILDKDGKEITLDTKLIDVGESVFSPFKGGGAGWQASTNNLYPDITVREVLLGGKLNPEKDVVAIDDVMVHRGEPDSKPFSVLSYFKAFDNQVSSLADITFKGLNGTTFRTIFLIDKKLKAGQNREDCPFLNGQFNAQTYDEARELMVQEGEKPKGVGLVEQPRSPNLPPP